VGPDHYLLNLQEAKRTVGIPIIGSLNGASDGGWTRYAHHIQESGADALELNIYFVPTDPDMDPKEIEDKYVDLVASVRAKISIPLAIKIGPFFTNAGHIAKRLVEAGANGLVVFNRYLEPDIDIDALRIEPKLVLSNRHELWLALRWIAILRSSCTASLAATSGIHVAKDVAKALLAGADVAMIASVLMTHGVEHIAKLLTELCTWMEEKEYQSVKQLRGSMSRDKCPDPSALERINYTKALVSYVPDVL